MTSTACGRSPKRRSTNPTRAVERASGASAVRTNHSVAVPRPGASALLPLPHIDAEPVQPSRWFADPPPADGAKVVISDTDHYAPGGGDALWAWQSFVRGHHPIVMDFGLSSGVESTGRSNSETAPASFEGFEPARWAMGDTRRFAERMNLIEMVPRDDLSSTGYALPTRAGSTWCSSQQEMANLLP